MQEEYSMKLEFNKSKIEGLISQLLAELGDDPSRPGLVETPKRVAKACCELFEGMRYTNEEIAQKYDLKHIFTFERNISNKTMPLKNSPTNKSGKTVSTMNKEYIIALEKI